MNRSFRIILVFVVIVIILTTFIAKAVSSHEVELLWPPRLLVEDKSGGAPAACGYTEGDKPTLTIYLPVKEKTTGTAVVICPGGGYGHLAMDHEGHQIAQWLNSLGSLVLFSSTSTATVVPAMVIQRRIVMHICYGMSEI